MSDIHDIAILIPSLQPDHRLTEYVLDLLGNGYHRIIVVDDGSGDGYRDIFLNLEKQDGCKVLYHDVNLGKGEAIKTGLRHILKNPSSFGVITADSDGQHTVADVTKMADALMKDRDSVHLGSRDFSLDIVPPKSRIGNRITSVIFAMLYGRWLPDTQTGLRAFSSLLIPMMISVPGARYEYEMNMLIHCSGRSIRMSIVPIETIYHDDNKGSHFRPFQDSVRIYKLLFTNFFKFASASALSTVLDLSIFTLLDKWLLFILFPAVLPVIFPGFDTHVLMAACIARVISAGFNFKVNKRFVFDIKKRKGAFLRYCILCVMVITASSAFVSLFKEFLGMDKTFAKAIIDGLLFFVNYRVQRVWVFSSREKND